MNTSYILNKIYYASIHIYRHGFGRMALWAFVMMFMLLGINTPSYAHNVGFLTMGIRLDEDDTQIKQNSQDSESKQTHSEKKATEAYMPTAGIAEVEHTDIDDFGTLDVAIWFPTTRAPQTITIGRWQFQAARNAKPVEGRFPLVIISHDAGELRLSHHNLAKFLAQNGFVVAALTHPHDCNTDMSTMFTLQQIVHRPQHITHLLDDLLASPKTKEMIDSQHIAFIGFGVGATTGLTLAGAVPNPAPWPSYCAHATASDVYCGPWAKQRLDTMALAMADALSIPENKPAKPKKKSLAEDEIAPIYPKMPTLCDTRIRSFTLITPSYGMFFPASSLRNVNAPILLVQAKHDSINQAPFHADALRMALPTTPEFFHLKEAGHFSLRDMPTLTPRHNGIKLHGSINEEEDITNLEATLSPDEKAATQDYVQQRIVNFIENTMP